MALTCTIREEHEAEFAQVLSDYLDRRPARCVAREAYTRMGLPRSYRLVERWSDRTHLDQHLASDEHRALVGGLRALGTLDVEESVFVRDPAADDSDVRSAVALVLRDLQTPLAAVAALVDRVLTALAADDLRAATACCAELQHVVADVVALLRIGSGTLRVGSVETRVRDLVRSVARAYAPVAIARGVAMETDAGSVAFRLDATLVTQMLDELVRDALRRAGSGDRIQLAAWSAGDDLCLAVRGTGEPPGSFDVGSYLCAAAAKALGGELAQVPRPGWTTSFEVRLPRLDDRGSQP